MTKRHAFVTLLGGAVALGLAMVDARAFDDATYPAFRGSWVRTARGGSAGLWDSTKPPGLKQEAPLTPEYEAIFVANFTSLHAGGQEFNPATQCLPAGMPRVMVANGPLEFIVTPDITYVRSDHLPELRRIYTDGRDWPQNHPPAFQGYSIGRWVDEDGDGHYDALEVETRGMKGPRVLDNDGLVLHRDNRTIVKERIALDKTNRNLLHNEITTFDSALTRPWTVVRSYRRESNPTFPEFNCGADNHYIFINGESYFLSADGFLMPLKKDQPAPDLRKFGQSRK